MHGHLATVMVVVFEVQSVPCRSQLVDGILHHRSRSATVAWTGSMVLFQLLDTRIASCSHAITGASFKSVCAHANVDGSREGKGLPLWVLCVRRMDGRR